LIEHWQIHHWEQFGYSKHITLQLTGSLRHPALVSVEPVLTHHPSLGNISTLSHARIDRPEVNNSTISGCTNKLVMPPLFIHLLTNFKKQLSFIMAGQLSLCEWCWLVWLTLALHLTPLIICILKNKLIVICLLIFLSLKLNGCSCFIAS
jgi:hypothetical protein